MTRSTTAQKTARPPSVGPAPAGKLLSALLQYQSDADLPRLRRTYAHHVAGEQRKQSTIDLARHHFVCKQPEGFASAVRRAFISFSIMSSRHHPYQQYAETLSRRSDVEAIRSDWQAVGEDLSGAMIRYILEAEGN